MSRDYDIVYPDKGKITFDGGANTKYERSLIPDNESPACFNVVFTNGAAGTWSGSTKLNTTSVGSFVGDGIYTRHDNSGAQTMIVFAGGTALALTGASTFATIPSAQSVFTAGVRVGATQMENHLFCGNGGVEPYKWNGANWTRHGVPAPSASGFTATVSATGGTFPAATYYYKVSNVNSQSVEGDVSTMIGGFAVGLNGSVELSGIPTAPTSHGVNARRLYRASGSSATFERITTISDNSTTTFSDTCLPVGTAAPTDNGEPPNYSVIAQHDSRLFMNDPANPNFIWYTEVGEPYTVKSTSFQAFGDGSLDLARGIQVYANGVVVQADRAHYLWYMPSTEPTDWRVIRIPTGLGSKSPFGAFLYNNKLMVPAMESGKFVGFAAISGSTVDPSATSLEVTAAGSDLKSDRIEPDMYDVQEPYVGNISAMVFKNKAYISVTDGTSNTQNNLVWVFDFSMSNLRRKQEAGWSPISGLNAAQFTVYDGRLFYISSTATGFVYQLETGTYSVDGAAQDSYFWTKEFAGLPGHENYEKDFRFANVLVDKAGAYYMTMNWRVDSDIGEGTSKQVDLTPGGSIWNQFTWGLADWGGGRAQDEIRIPIGPARGKRIQFKFSNQNAAGQRFKVHHMTYTYNLKGKR